MAKSSENLVQKWIHPRKIEPTESTNVFILEERACTVQSYE